MNASGENSPDNGNVLDVTAIFSGVDESDISRRNVGKFVFLSVFEIKIPFLVLKPFEHNIRSQGIAAVVLQGKDIARVVVGFDDQPGAPKKIGVLFGVGIGVKADFFGVKQPGIIRGLVPVTPETPFQTVHYLPSPAGNGIGSRVGKT